MRGLGTTDAERGVVHGTGPVMEAEAAEFLLTAGTVAGREHTLPCPTYEYEATRARTSGLRRYLLCALVTARPCVGEFVNN